MRSFYGAAVLVSLSVSSPAVSGPENGEDAPGIFGCELPAEALDVYVQSARTRTGFVAPHAL